jgi:Ni,Fe-hydrogenase III component G
MDFQLQERFRVYEQEKLASAEIVNFVRDILLWLEHTSHHPCTEESAGALASHLMLALARVSQGKVLGSAWYPVVHEEAMSLTPLVPWAGHIQREAKRVLGLTLPPEEFDFLLLHLGAFHASASAETEGTSIQ